MARPERNNVDYFPFLCKEGRAMYFIEQKYGNDGYAVWIKILRQLAVTNYHYLNLSDRVEFMFLSSKCRVSETVLESIINDLCMLGEFNQELWENYRIIFNEKLIETIQDAYKKRNSNCITLPGLFLLLSSLGILKPSKSNLSSSGNPQSKVKESKVKESKGNRGFQKPELLDLQNYFTEKAKNWTPDKIKAQADKFYNHYQANGWKVGKNPMKSWQAAASGWISRDGEYSQNNIKNQSDEPKPKQAYNKETDWLGDFR